MRLLDLFCGAGGCAVGYNRAGFDEIVGVDHVSQKHYPFEFVQADALEYLRDHWMEFDVIHASPPCQRYSQMTRAEGTQLNHPDLVDPVRVLLRRTCLPWVIENVVFAPLRSPICLCGTMFGLKVIRHRLFESNVYLMTPGQRCWHPKSGSVGRAGVRGKKVGDWISVAGSVDRVPACVAMGVDWPMTRKEIAQAIPPAYTKWIGKQLLDAIGSRSI